MNSKKKDDLKILSDKLMSLQSSALYEYRIKNGYKPVFGEGNPDALIMVIGEAPGKEEALSGRPFCGRSGALLNEMLALCGLDRLDIYITNIVKDRPEDNRDPMQSEILMYEPILLEEINIVRPKVLVTLGRFSMEWVIKRFSDISQSPSISDIHGKIIDGHSSYGAVKILPLYHPAATMYNPKLLPLFKADFQQIKNLV